jgi:hypothetical protein
MTEYARAGGATTAYQATGSVPGKVVPLMLAFSRSDAAGA